MALNCRLPRWRSGHSFITILPTGSLLQNLGNGGADLVKCHAVKGQHPDPTFPEKV
jgi:hypothetical protein